MSVSNTSGIDASGNAWQQRRAVHQQRHQDFLAMINDVRQGNLSGAQQALASLQSNLPNASAASGTGAKSGSAQDFASLINSMQTGGSVASAGSSSSTSSASAGNDMTLLFNQMLSQLQMSSLGGASDGDTDDALSALTGASAATLPSALFSNLGQDLSSSNLSQARQGYQQLQQDLQANSQQSQPAHHRHHHHHGGGQVQAALNAYQANSSAC
ncbi:hypothetical protein ACSVCE_09170 [Chromobacterium haemolyticum]|uniref:hypothetical protein n=1 Tax=Chromobacterium haemolyticum TaxID=394935 RepID=UPI00405596AE